MMLFEVWIQFCLMSALISHSFFVLFKLICISVICILTNADFKQKYQKKPFDEILLHKHKNTDDIGMMIIKITIIYQASTRY